MDPKLKSESANRFLRELKLQKEEDRLIDFTIGFDDGSRLRAHKCVLAAHSNYFSDMFAQAYAPECIEASVLYGMDISYQTFSTLVEFCYTGELIMNKENVQDTIVAASRLESPSVREMASEFIGKITMNVSIRPDIYMCAGRNHTPNLLARSRESCLTNYKDVVNEEKFLQLDIGCLHPLIADERLKVTSEELVFYPVLKWAKVDLDKRKSDAGNSVYYAAMEPEKLVRLSD